MLKKWLTLAYTLAVFYTRFAEKKVQKNEKNEKTTKKHKKWLTLAYTLDVFYTCFAEKKST